MSSAGPNRAVLEPDRAVLAGEGGRLDDHLDEAAVDPQNPPDSPAYDTGDRLHLNSASHQVMANAIHLELFADRAFAVAPRR